MNDIIFNAALAATAIGFLVFLARVVRFCWIVFGPPSEEERQRDKEFREFMDRIMAEEEERKR